MLGCRSQTEGILGRDVSVNLSKYFYKTENMLESDRGWGIKLLKQHEKFHWNVKEAYCANLSQGAWYSLDWNLCQLSDTVACLRTPLLQNLRLIVNN